METESYITKIKELYNECWGSYKQYLIDHDMRQYNDRQTQIMAKYDCTEASNLLLFFAPIVNRIHESYR